MMKKIFGVEEDSNEEESGGEDMYGEETMDWHHNERNCVHVYEGEENAEGEEPKTWFNYKNVTSDDKITMYERAIQSEELGPKTDIIRMDPKKTTIIHRERVYSFQSRSVHGDKAVTALGDPKPSPYCCPP